MVRGGGEKGPDRQTMKVRKRGRSGRGILQEGEITLRYVGETDPYKRGKSRGADDLELCKV